MRRFVALAAALCLCVAIIIAHTTAHASAHAPAKGAPIRPADTSSVQPTFGCWSAVTIIHPLPIGPVTTYYAHFGYTSTANTTVPQSESYTTPTLNLTPPTSFNAGTYTDAYVPAFDPAHLPTWFVYANSATVVKTSATQCGGVH